MEKWWSIQERWLAPGPSTSPIESENTPFILFWAQEHEKFEVVMAKPCQRWCLKRRIWGMSQNYGPSKSIGFLDQPFVGANLVRWCQANNMWQFQETRSAMKKGFTPASTPTSRTISSSQSISYLTQSLNTNRIRTESNHQKVSDYFLISQLLVCFPSYCHHIFSSWQYSWYYWKKKSCTSIYETPNSTNFEKFIKIIHICGLPVKY